MCVNNELIEIENQESEEILLTTPTNVKVIIKDNINTAPGFGLNSGEILKELAKRALVKLTKLIHASFRLKIFNCGNIRSLNDS